MVVGQHVFHIDRVVPDVHDPVAAVHDVAFLGDEDVFALGKKDALVAVLAAGKAVELQVDRAAAVVAATAARAAMSGGSGFGIGGGSACERKMSRPVPL